MVFKTSMASKAVVSAYDRGYRVSDKGIVVKPDGAPAYATKIGKHRRYSAFSYRMGSKSVKIYIHHLACYQAETTAYLILGRVARHLNDDPDDNRPSNIVSGTPDDNEHDKKINRRSGSAKTKDLFIGERKAI